MQSMTFEIIEASPPLAIDRIEISRLRSIYRSESLAASLSIPVVGIQKKNYKFIRRGISRIIAFAPRDSHQREFLRKFWRFTPNFIQLLFLASNSRLATSNTHAAISGSFNIDRGFGLITSDKPLVSIVIPVHNKFNLTLQCLRAIQLNWDVTPFEVIVINDASSDWTKTALANIRGIRVVDLQENVGYLRATNIGISASRGKYVALLNNDTIPLSGWLDRLVAELESDSKIGIAGSKLLYPNMQVQELGSQIFSDGSGWNLGKYSDHFSPEHSFNREVDYVSAAAILVRADLLAETNGFDELYIPAYYEDADLAMQARKHGFKVVAVHDSFVIHLEGGSHGANTNQGVKQFQEINKAKFVEKWTEELTNHWNPDNGPRLESKRDSKGIVLIYDSQIPQSSRDAGSQRATQIAKNLSNLGFHVIYFASDETISIIDVIHLRDFGIEIHTNHDSLKNSLAGRANRVRGIWIQRISVATAFYDQVRKEFPMTPIVFDTIDLVSSRIRREKQEGIKSEMTLGEAVALEKKFALKSTLTLTVSEDEKSKLQLLAPKGNFETLWMSFETVQDWIPRKNLQNTGLFVGNFRHTPNKVSLYWFIELVLPQIIEINQDFVLNVVGTGLNTTEVESISVKGVNFLGFVDDLAPLYQNAKVVVVPLQYGAGIKGKMCEALSHASAVVSTSYGAEGLGLTDGDEYLLADSGNEFAQKVIEVLNDNQLRNQVSKAAFDYSKANLSADSFSKKIEEIARIFE